MATLGPGAKNENGDHPQPPKKGVPNPYPPKRGGATGGLMNTFVLYQKPMLGDAR